MRKKKVTKKVKPKKSVKKAKFPAKQGISKSPKKKATDKKTGPKRRKLPTKKRTTKKSNKTRKPSAKQGISKSSKKKKAKKAVEKESTVRQFTIKQQRLIDCYAGDIKEAAKKAGLSYDYARRLVTKSHILEAIRNRQDTEVRPKEIANRQKRQEFWTQIMSDKKEDTRDRLKASELLGKSEADFTENLSHKFPESCGVMLVGGQMDPNKWKNKSKQHHKHGSRNPK